MDKDESPLVWEEGTPRSSLYGDIYFSLEDGLAESRTVFLEGCGLPQAWSGRRDFTVAELGFGSGLNICALIELWKGHRPPDGQLNIFTIEAHLIAREDAARALAAFPEIAEAAGLLLAQWPPRTPGVHRIEIARLGVVVEVAVLEVAQALQGWEGRADAWFLDGFSPALNPAMWRDEVLDLVAARSEPSARAATFTVAGAVRRGLADRGFAVERKPGFGRKRERLEARLPGPGDPVVILGCGIAGAALARAFEALGQSVRVFEDPGSPPASGNPAALVTPALDAGGGARAALYAACFARAVALYGAIPDAVIARGAFQLETEARDAARFDKVAAQALFPSGGMQRQTPADVRTALDEAGAPGGLFIRDGLVIDPATVREAWAPMVQPGRAVEVSNDAGGLRVVFEGGRTERARHVIIANGHAAAQLLVAGPQITPVRGQATVTRGGSTKPVAFGAYAIPTRTGVLYGATHNSGVADLAAKPEHDAANLEHLSRRLPGLAEALKALPVTARVGIRATTRDRMPLAGRLSEGVFILSGLGSRGFTTAPLLAEHVAALALGQASPLPDQLAATVSANRFVQL